MSPLNAAICTTTYLERQKCYGPDKKILLKKQLSDLEVKGQGPTKVIRVCGIPPYGHAPTYQISLNYLERNNYLTLRSKVKVPWRSLWYMTHRLMVMHPHTKYRWPISKDKNVMAQTRKYYLKNNYLTLSRVSVGFYYTKVKWPNSYKFLRPFVLKGTYSIGQLCPNLPKTYRSFNDILRCGLIH